MKRSDRKRGITLIEVLAALTLLVTALSGVLITQKRLTDQRNRAARVIEATELVDQLLFDWNVEQFSIPTSARGRFPEEERYLWKTDVVDASHRTRLGLEVVRLSVFYEQEAAPAELVLSVDLAAAVPLPLSSDAVANTLPQ